MSYVEATAVAAIFTSGVDAAVSNVSFRRRKGQNPFRKHPDVLEANIDNQSVPAEDISKKAVLPLLSLKPSFLKKKGTSSPETQHRQKRRPTVPTKPKNATNRPSGMQTCDILHVRHAL